MPMNVSNTFVSYAMQIKEQLPPFDYEPMPSPNSNKRRVKKPVVRLADGNEYEGEWDLEGKKDGRGMQIYSDGSIYEGYWTADLPDGRGRLIHANGDVYAGEWKADKAHGFGVYEYENGARYEGQWENDLYHG